MDAVSKTLFIPLYGKAYVSRRGIILKDEKAESVWAEEGFAIKGKSASKWLALYMGMRAAVFDDWLREKMAEDPDATVLHLGCGMDSRVLRVGNREHLWYDVDLPEVIAQRRRHYGESEHYHMLPFDVTDSGLLDAVSGSSAIVVMEGISMYLPREELLALLARLRGRFDKLSILMDCYTDLAASMSRYKNPVHDVGVGSVYSVDDPRELEEAGIRLVSMPNMTPPEMIAQLAGVERQLFRRLYAGRLAGKLYRMYEYEAW